MDTKLKFKEHYFTASKHLGGFFTIDNTPGLDKSEIAELEKKGVYAPPPEIRPVPSKQEIKDLFPVNIAFYRLESSGRFVLLHSVYTGITNHSTSRYGNYFSHSLVLAEGEPNFPVKLIFDAKKFKTEFSLDEDAGYKYSLTEDDIIAVGNSEYNISVIFEDLKKFLLLDNRINILSKIFDLIVEGKIEKIGYNITICDVKDNLSWWLFSVNYFLPRKLANKISFASYVDNPENPNYPFEITGIVPECDIQKLPEKFFTLIDVGKVGHYLATQPYTKALINIIETGTYSDLVNLQKEVEEHDITQLNTKLNIPVAYHLFKQDIKSRTLEQFLGLMGSIADNERKLNEIVDFVQCNNSALFYQFIKQGFLDYCKGDVDERWGVFLRYYEKRFENGGDFTNKFFADFIDAYLNKAIGLTEFKTAVLVLSNVNINYIKNEMRIKLFDKTEQYFDWEKSTKEILFHSNAMMDNMKKWNVLTPFKEAISRLIHTKNAVSVNNLNSFITNNGFFSLDQNKEFSSLKVKYKTGIVIWGLNDEFRKSKVICNHRIDFGKYVDFVKRHLKENESEVWRLFFEKNADYNCKKDLDFYSPGYLKKLFASYLFLKKADLNPLRELDLKSSMAWIEEYVLEHADNQEAIDFFNEFKIKSAGSNKFG